MGDYIIITYAKSDYRQLIFNISHKYNDVCSLGTTTAKRIHKEEKSKCFWFCQNFYECTVAYSNWWIRTDRVRRRGGDLVCGSKYKFTGEWILEGKV